MLARGDSSVIDQALLAESLGKLDAGTRALLDLSLRRAIPDDQVAKVLGVDPGSIPPRRARGIAQLADMMEVPGPSELAALLIAIPDLPEEAWGVPSPEPFKGGVTSARRAKAFRRVAVAASPLVALGAVMAAVVVASSSDHSGPSAASSVARRAGGTGAAPAVTAPAPEARHGLPDGVQLSRAQRPAHRAHHRRHHAARHHGAGSTQPATLARQPASTVEHSVPVAYHPPAVVHQQPRHVTHHHTPAKPKVPSAPTPAPIQTPSQPVSTPAPTQTQTVPTVEVSPPQQTTTVHSGPAPTSGKPHKTPPAPVNLSPPSSSERTSHRGGGSCGHHGDSGPDQSSADRGSSHHWHGDDSRGQSSGGRSFSPPGLFRKHH